jgi:hypothetical protein
VYSLQLTLFVLVEPILQLDSVVAWRVFYTNDNAYTITMRLLFYMPYIVGVESSLCIRYKFCNQGIATPFVYISQLPPSTFRVTSDGPRSRFSLDEATEWVRSRLGDCMLRVYVSTPTRTNVIGGLRSTVDSHHHGTYSTCSIHTSD